MSPDGPGGLDGACEAAIAAQRRRTLASTSSSTARFSLEEHKRAPVRRRPGRSPESAPVHRDDPLPPQPARGEPVDPNSLQWNNYGGIGQPQIAVTPLDEAQTPVIVPDDPKGLVQPQSAAARLLGQSALIIVRQLEMLNIFIGFEQASRFAITSPSGENVGYLLEENLGLVNTMGRQLLRNHRAFKCTVMDLQGNIVLRIQRPVSFINSRITITAGSDEPETVPAIGEARQVWAPLRRKYDLFIRAREGDDENAFQQFAAIDAPFLAWDFDALDSENKVCASINRRWAGFGRELFTDTGQYVLRFDAVVDDTAVKLLTTESASSARSNNKQHGQNMEKASQASDEDREKALVLAQERTTQGLTLDQRAVLLACAVSIDVDFFSRARGGPGTDAFLLPFFWGGGGGGDDAPATGEGPGAEGQGGDPNGPTGGSPYPGDEDAPLPQTPPPPSDQLPPDYQEGLGEGEVFEDPWGNPQQDPWGSTGGSGDGGSSGGGGWDIGDWS